MMIQLVDTISWISALIHETKTWRSDKGACLKSDNTFSEGSVSRFDNTAVKLCRLESFDDV